MLFVHKLKTAVTCAALFAGAGISAQSTPRIISVDLALILAVDVSRSMNVAEQNAQRDGYVAAFRSREIFRSIAAGPRGKIAVTYVEWSGQTYQRTIVPLSVITSPRDAEAFAARMAALPVVSGIGTSLSGALAYAGVVFDAAPVLSERRVLDVSGDGPNNRGMPIQPIREALIANGVTINGLAISLPPDGSPDLADSFGDGFVATYYNLCVIGGPGSFVIEVDALAKFERAIRQKLLLEIAGTEPQVMHAGYRNKSPKLFDCETGAHQGR